MGCGSLVGSAGVVVGTEDASRSDMGGGGNGTLSWCWRRSRSLGAYGKGVLLGRCGPTKQRVSSSEFCCDAKALATSQSEDGVGVSLRKRPATKDDVEVVGAVVNVDGGGGPEERPSGLSCGSPCCRSMMRQSSTEVDSFLSMSAIPRVHSSSERQRQQPPGTWRRRCRRRLGRVLLGGCGR